MRRRGDEKTDGVQAGMVGYYGIPRTPASLLTALTCDSIRPGKQNLNPSFFCDRKVDAEIARAQKIQITNPYAAVGRWARIENQLVDLAPWVPLFTPWSGDLVSQRVGNYQYNPALGILLDQLWVHFNGSSRTRVAPRPEHEPGEPLTRVTRAALTC